MYMVSGTSLFIFQSSKFEYQCARKEHEIDSLREAIEKELPGEDEKILKEKCHSWIDIVDAGDDVDGDHDPRAGNEAAEDEKEREEENDACQHRANASVTIDIATKT